MTVITNNQDITSINAQHRISVYCPIGKDYYTADVLIQINPGKVIPDYCELTNYLNNLSGLSLIIEELVNKIYKHIMSKYNPHTAKVSVKAYSNTHLNVEVTKDSEELQ